LITLTVIFSVGFTNGGIAVWTLNEILPFALPEFLGKLTMPMIIAGTALYK
jgi:hypothetical protein